MSRLKIVYICSLGHSGSTLLDIMINQHSDIQSVGEIMFFDEWVKNNNKCTCLKLINECLFWTCVIPRCFNGLGSVKDSSYLDNSYKLFKEIKDLTGKTIILDSSKSVKRLNMLLEDNRLDVKIIHLVRNGLGVVNSLKKSYERSAINDNQNKTKIAGALKGTIRWIRRNLAFYTLMKSHGIDNYLEVRYEDLCMNPDIELENICSFIELDYDKKMIKPSLNHCHNIGGSRWRFSDQPINIKLDEKWKVELSLFSKIIFQILGSWLNRRYGY